MGKGKGKWAQQHTLQPVPVTFIAPVLPQRRDRGRSLWFCCARARAPWFPRLHMRSLWFPRARARQTLRRMFPRGPSFTASAPQFDLATALTKKEARVIRKAEYMIPYHMARCPAYGWKESEEYARAEELKEKIAGIEAKAKKRWEGNFC